MGNRALLALHLLRSLAVASCLLVTSSVALSAPKAPVAPGATPAPTALSVASSERNAIVELMVQDRKVSVGFVLEGDGRILTNLLPLGRGVGLVARYADNSRTNLRVVHSDRQWDLALLAPEDQRWTTGFLASKIDPFEEGGALRLLRLERNAVKSVPLPAPRRENLTGGDASVLSRALTFGQVLTAADLGAPVVDAGGSVVGIVAQGCLPTVVSRCSVAYYAAPTSELRRFLSENLAARNIPVPWLGMTVAPETGGPVAAARILAVLPNSPASALGLRTGKKGDLLLAVNSTPVGSPKDLAELLHRQRSGDKVTLLLLADGRFCEVRVTLGRYPDAAWTGSSPPIPQPDLGY